MAIHIGKHIKDHFDNEPKGHTVTWFARCLNCHRVNVYDIFKRGTIDTTLLWHISKILNHNFFRDLSEAFDDEQRSNEDENVNS